MTELVSESEQLQKEVVQSKQHKIDVSTATQKSEDDFERLDKLFASLQGENSVIKRSSSWLKAPVRDTLP